MKKFLFLFRIKDNVENIFKLPHENVCMFISIFLIISGYLPMVVADYFGEKVISSIWQFLFGFSLMFATMKRSIRAVKYAYYYSLFSIAAGIGFVGLHLIYPNFCFFLWSTSSYIIFGSVSFLVLLVLVQFSLITFMYYRELILARKQRKLEKERENNRILENPESILERYEIVNSNNNPTYSNNNQFTINSVSNDFQNVYSPPKYQNK